MLRRKSQYKYEHTDTRTNSNGRMEAIGKDAPMGELGESGEEGGREQGISDTDWESLAMRPRSRPARDHSTPPGQDDAPAARAGGDLSTGANSSLRARDLGPEAEPHGRSDWRPRERHLFYFILEPTRAPK